MSVLSPRSFVLLRSLLLLAVYAPHLLAYAALTRAGRWWRARSGTHLAVLRAECHQAEKELALVKIRRNDIDELALPETASSADESAASDASAAPSPLLSSPPQVLSPPAIGAQRGPDAGGRWAALMDAWRWRRLAPLPAPGADLGHHGGTNDVQTAARLARVEAQLATVARLLQRDAQAA
ncbi:hypothetical protein IWQ56_002364 [Coemansia nantahalensis]|nr:hypothetical protein IWQ56_002364 [Coemansia nantahalensis]